VGVCARVGDERKCSQHVQFSFLQFGCVFQVANLQQPKGNGTVLLYTTELPPKKKGWPRKPSTKPLTTRLSCRSKVPGCAYWLPLSERERPVSILCGQIICRYLNWRRPQECRRCPQHSASAAAKRENVYDSLEIE
jgi:hypothetical protein